VVSAKTVDDQLIDDLVSRAQAAGLQQPALEGEIADHLGYDKHEPAGQNGVSSRNG
jgi:hypothetical protein